MSFSPVGLCGAGLMQTCAIASSAQSGVTPGTIIAGSDTQGAYLTINQATKWQICNNGLYSPGHSKLHQISSIMWSAHETGPTGVSAIYALTGDAGTGGATSGGGLAVSLDGAQTWTCRSTAVMGGGNHAGTDVVSANWPRPAGRLLAEDGTYLYCATYGQGVKRSADHGNTWPVTFKMAGTTPAQGAYICYGLFLDSTGGLWLVTYPTTASNGGLWHCPAGTAAGQAQSSAPNFTAVALPAGIGTTPGPLTIDVIQLGGVVYLACGTNGVWNNAGGTWHNLSGPGNGGTTGIDTANGSYWNTIDGYVDASGNHVIVTACSNPPLASVNGIECIAQIKVTNPGSSQTLSWSALAVQSTVTVDPIPGHGPGGVPGYDPFTTTTGTALAKGGFVNPCVRFDPSDSTHRTIICTGSNGMYLSTNAGASWQMCNNGDAAFLGHSVAADPNNAGYLMFGDSDWGAWQVSDGVGVGGVSADSGATIQRVDTGGQAYAFTYDPVDSTVYVAYGTGKYGAGTGDVKSKGHAAWTWGASLNPPFTNVPFGAVAFRDASNNKILLVAVGGKSGTAGTIWQYNATASTWSSAAVLTGFGPQGNAPTLHFPMVYAGGGVVYAADRVGGLWRSTSYGASGSWTNIAGTATYLSNSGLDIAVNPHKPGELWIAANAAVYKLTSANTGTAIGSGITATKYTGTNNEVANPAAIAFDTTGNLYCAVSDSGSGTGVVQCAGNATTSPDGNTWTDVVGDESFAQCNGNPENMAIGPDGHIYVSGSNAVAQGFIASSASINEVQNSTNQASTLGGSLGLYFNQSGAAANLAGSTLIVRLELNSGSTTITGPAGWVLDVDEASGTAGSGVARVQIWRYANAPAGMVGTTSTAAVTFTQGGASTIAKGRITEFAPATAGQVIYPDQTGVASGTAATAMPVAASKANTVAGGLAVAAFAAAFSTAPTAQSWNTPTGWTNDGVATNANGVFSFLSQTGITTGPTSISGTGIISTSTNMTGWAAALATYYAAAPATLRVTTRSPLPAATQNTLYSVQLTASGGLGGDTWTATGLPGGLSCSAGGLIQGTPAAAGTSSVAVTVTDSRGNTASATLSLTVNSTGPALSPSAPFLLGSAHSASASSVTITPLQATSPNDNISVGVAINTAGVTPSVTDTGGNTYTAVASDTTETGAQVWTFESVNSSALALTDTIRVTLSGTSAVVAIAADDPDGATGASAVTAHGSSTAPSASSPSLTAPVEQNCVAFLADTNAGGAPAWNAAWTPLVTVADGGSHLYLSVAALQKTSSTAVSITASATITSAPWAMALLYEPIDVPQVSSTLSDGVVGAPYSQALTATHGSAPYTYSAAGLPPGLSLAAGTVVGTPTISGLYEVTLTVTDAFGFTSSTVQLVTIIGAPPPSAVVQAMPGNLLTVTDAIPATGFTWKIQANATTPVLNATHPLVGTSSLYWTAAAAGATSLVVARKFAVSPQSPYVASAYLFTSSNLGPNAVVGIDWYDLNGRFISSSTGSTPFAQGPGVWQSVQVAAASPIGAVSGDLFVEVDNANAGDVNYLGLAFVAQTGAQVLIDFQNPAFVVASAAGSNWTDCSPWLRLDQNININRGRQDAVSEISTGSASFMVQNDAGYFTPGNSGSLIAALGGTVTLAARCQINLADEVGNWYTRFDGPVAQIDYTLDPTGNTNLAQIYAADILAEMGRQDQLDCWTREQVLNDTPLYHWALNDYTTVFTSQSQAQQQNISTQVVKAQQASYLAAETSGNGGPPLKAMTRAAPTTDSSGNTVPALAWADTSGGVETLADAARAGSPDGSEFWPAGSILPTTACRGLDSGTVGPFTTPTAGVYFTPKLSGGTAENQFAGNAGYTLSARLPQPLLASGDFTAECWFTLDPNVAADGTLNYGPYIVLSLGSTRGSQVICAGAYQNNSTVPKAGAAYYSMSPGFASLNFSGLSVAASSSALRALASGTDSVQRPHHLVLVAAYDVAAPTVSVYVDNALIGTLNVAPGVTFDQIVVGGAYGGGGAHYGGVQLVSVYDYQLSPQQIALHCQLGQYGMWESTTDDCIAQLASYANLPPFWNGVTAQHAGLTLTDYYDITGATALSAMQTYEQAEGGLLFVNAAGQLTFHTRDYRMAYGAPLLTLPPDSYSEQLGLEVIDTYQTNENAVASVAYPGGAFFINHGSQEQYGTYATNQANSPAQLPLISWSRAFAAQGIAELANSPDPAMSDAAAWPANARSAPWLAPGSVLVNLLTVDPSWGVNVSDIYGLEINECITLGGGLPESLPNQAGTVDWFIEGVAEVYGLTTRTITFYGSPADAQRAWLPGDPVYGVLGSTARIGVSATDLSTPQADGKDVSHDGGPPFWAPAFSAGMNASPVSVSGQGFVGGNDMRGLTWPLQQALKPPLMVAASGAGSQLLAAGALTQPQVFLDTVFCDSVNGMGVLPNWPNWYVCLNPGFYEIDATLPWNAVSSNGSYALQSWIVVARQAAQQLAVPNSTFSPLSNGTYVCPVGETVRQNSVGVTNYNAPSTRVYLGLGDMIALAAEQSTPTSRTIVPGVALTIRQVAQGTIDDAAQYNSSIVNGGTVFAPPTNTPQKKTYQCVHTYSHYGSTASSSNGPYALRNEDGNCYQGASQGALKTTGSQFSLIRFDWTTIQSDLIGRTITSVTLTCNNNKTWYTAMQLLGGYYYTNNETSAWHPAQQSSPPDRDLWTEQFTNGQKKTFQLDPAIFQQYFVGKTAHGIIIGDDSTAHLTNYGYFAGGPNSWTLVVNYK